MIFSGVLLVCFTIVFGLEVYLATFIQEINLIKCSTEAIINLTEDDFLPFKYIHIILDFVVIILFILNIFDLNIQDDNSNEAAKRPINLNFYLGTEENQGGVEIAQN